MADDRGRNRGGGRAGFVLVAVLSVTTLLALIFGGTTFLARGSVETARVDMQELEEEALLASAIELAGHQLFVLRNEPLSLTGQQLRLTGGTATLTIQPEAGRIDLNGADEVLLAAAYRASGLGGMSPEAFAARVMDWRDEDDDQRPDGAEAPSYATAGLNGGPGNAPFRSVADLRWMIGIGNVELAALSPFLTVSNPSGRVDPIYASPAVLAAIPGLPPDAEATLSGAAGQTGIERIFALRFAVRGLERHFVLGERLRVFSVRAEVRRDGTGPVRTVDAVLIASVMSDRPFQITQWTER